MIILKPIATAQNIKFIGRQDLCDFLILRDEQNNTEVEVNGVFSLSTYYLTASLMFSLVEGRFYNITAYKSLISDYVVRVEADGGTVEGQTCLSELNIYNREIVYKDKVFCTAQTVADYSINNGTYTQHSSNNEFITI